jgi:hypothetical protein
MKKMVFNRNKKQLINIINDKIKVIWEIREEREKVNDWMGTKVKDGKLSILYWVIEILNNPKKWDEDFEYNFQKFINDDEIFREVQ